MKMVGFLKSGQEAKDEVIKSEKEDEKRIAEMSRMWRFYLKEGEEADITFLDGEIDEDGDLELLTYYEHVVNVGGNWENFVCIAEDEPCPICAMGNKPRMFVAAFTVIDHRTYEGKKNTYKDTKKLFICKKKTLKQLQTLASKLGGLKGKTFSVTRSDENAPNVGDVFLNLEPKNLKLLATKKKKADKNFNLEPADYEKEIEYRDAKTLRDEFGFGTAAVGSESAIEDGADPDEEL